MRVTLVHNFHSEVRSVQHVCPGIQHATLAVQDRLVEVQPVKVERHCANAKSSKPDPHNGPCSEEEVKAAAIVEGGVLEN